MRTRTRMTRCATAISEALPGVQERLELKQSRAESLVIENGRVGGLSINSGSLRGIAVILAKVPSCTACPYRRARIPPAGPANFLPIY